MTAIKAWYDDDKLPLETNVTIVIMQAEQMCQIWYALEPDRPGLQPL